MDGVARKSSANARMLQDLSREMRVFLKNDEVMFWLGSGDHSNATERNRIQKLNHWLIQNFFPDEETFSSEKAAEAEDIQEQYAPLKKLRKCTMPKAEDDDDDDVKPEDEDLSVHKKDDDDDGDDGLELFALDCPDWGKDGDEDNDDDDDDDDDEEEGPFSKSEALDQLEGGW
jgi:hypothetical protein